jgi:hypothetical protein
VRRHVLASGNVLNRSLTGFAVECHRCIHRSIKCGGTANGR